MSINRRMASTEHSVAFILAVFLFAGCGPPPPPEPETRDIVLDQFPEEQAEIREVLFALSENARVHDAEGQRLAHLNSPKFTAFGPDKPSVKTFSEQVEGEVAFYSSLEDLNFEWEDDLKIDVFGDTAVATCLLSFSGTGSDGAKVDVAGARVTLVLVRTSDGWKIVHEHVS